MSPWLLFLLLLKAKLTSFSGLASLPVLRQDLVLTHHAITDAQLNAAVAVARSTPGPNGLYLVSVGYFIAGTPGAIAGWLALSLPALLIIPLIRLTGRHAKHPRLRGALDAVILASVGLLWASCLPLGRESVQDPLTAAILIVAILLLVVRKLDTIWVILGAAAVELLAASTHLVAGL